MRNGNEGLKAIVVDDEAIARKMVTAALENEGFKCYAAADGEGALSLLKSTKIDLLVTDLRMPNKNGHSLAVEVLEWPNRPIVAIHTAVADPRIIKDLMLRGVDDIVIKPTDYTALAAKMKVLTERRRETGDRPDDQCTRIQEAPAASISGVGESEVEKSADSLIVPENVACQPQADESNDDVRNKQENLTQNSENLKEPDHLLGIDALPLSPYALEIYRMTSDDEVQTAEIANKIEREPSLTAELLRVGNSSFYNRSQQKIHSIEKIVVKIGRRRLGQLALALNACSSLRSELLPFLDIDLIWRRSLAAGIAVQLILNDRGDADDDRGLVLSTTLHMLGRVVLARTYPEDYVAIVETAKQSGETLSALETKVFGASQSEQLANLLGAWKVPDDVTDPLRHFETSYSDLATLKSVQRSDAELVKIAALIGWLAAGPWEPWDVVEFPTSKVAFHASAFPIRELVDRTRRGLADLTGEQRTSSSADSNMKSINIRYLCGNDPDFDFFAQLLPALGLRPSRPSDLEADSPRVVNCLGIKPEDVHRRCHTLESDNAFMVCEPKNQDLLDRYGRPVVIPNRFGNIAECFVDGSSVHQFHTTQ